MDKVFPPEKGKFIKTIVAGHVSSAVVAEDISYLGKIYYDGESHYYIDGTVMRSGKIPILVYDSKKKEYYELKVGEWLWMKEICLLMMLGYYLIKH